MKEVVRTSVYSVIAALFVGGAFLVAHWTQPESIDEFFNANTPFHKDFAVDDVARLELIAIPEDETKPQNFVLANSGGTWRIESVNSYPAEAKERLAKTVAGALGIIRETLVGRSENQHARFGVVDPKDDNSADAKNAGKRIRLLDKEKNVLLDLIVGKRAKQADSEANSKDKAAGKQKDLYYVRRADEKETYLARIDLNISTKFSEWIEPDLLKLDGGDVRDLVIDNYEAERKQFITQSGQILEQAVVKNRETVQLNREFGGGEWKLDPPIKANETLMSAKLDDLLNVLDEMEILGVKPREQSGGTAALTHDLKFRPPKGSAVGLVWRSLNSDLTSHGFSLRIDEKTSKQADELLKKDGFFPVEMVSANGDVTAITDKGMVYHLHFGRIVVGSKKDIQLGGKPQSATTKKPAARKKTGKPAEKTEKQPAKKKSESNEELRRYVLIRVEYDEKYYRNQPKLPTKPIAPKSVPVMASKPQRGTPPVAARRPIKSKPVSARVPNPATRFRVLQQDYNVARRQYKTDLATYHRQQLQFVADVKKVKQTIRELNERFADWYFVISTKNLSRLTLRRKELIELPAAKTDATKKKKLP